MKAATRHRQVRCEAMKLAEGGRGVNGKASTVQIKGPPRRAARINNNVVVLEAGGFFLHAHGNFVEDGQDDEPGGPDTQRNDDFGK